MIKKIYKNIKIIECKNLKANADKVENITSLEPLINKITTHSNNEDIHDHVKVQNGGFQEYHLEADIKIIVMCIMKNYKVSNYIAITGREIS